MTSDLVLKLRLPSSEAADLVEARFGGPGVTIHRTGILQHPDGDEMVDSDGYHLDLIVPWSDVPQALRKYLVAPTMPKLNFAGRETDAVAGGELAPAQLVDLASADINALVPTDEEAAEIAGLQRQADLEAAKARLEARLAIIDMRLELEAQRAVRESAVAVIATKQAARDVALAAISAKQASKAAATTERDAQQAIIDNPASTGPQKQAARAAKQIAVDAIDTANAAISEAQTDRDAALAAITTAQAVRDDAVAMIAALRAELDSLKAARG